MVWAVLVLVGVPLWLCAIGILTVVLRTRRLHSRHDNIPVRVLRTGGTRWTRGNAIGVSDVFASRGSPAAWREGLFRVGEVHQRAPGPAEAEKLHRLGDDAAVIQLAGSDGGTRP